jgi:regulation of enolase protein 1 (concanavalin A-like superfamily)
VQNTNTYAKAGIMIRESSAPNAAHVILDVRPTGDLEFMTRPADGAATTFLATGSQQQPPPTWLKLTRSGTTVAAAVSGDGTTWTPVGTPTTLNVAAGALVGLVVCSVQANTLNASTFDNVTVTGGSLGGPPPSPWVDQDVGAVDAAGTTSWSSGAFTVKGAGTIWGTSDTFNFVNQPVTGNVTVVARLVAMQNTNTYAKAGIMIRESSAANAADVILDVRPTGDLEFMTRPTDGAATTFLATGSQQQPPPTWLKLTRSGTTVSAAVSGDGTTWTPVGSPTTLNIAAGALVGLVVCSVQANTLNTSTFDNVTVTLGSTPNDRTIVSK